MDIRKVVIYIAGAYSGEVAKNISTASDMAIKVWEAGFTALCPHLNTAHFDVRCKCRYEDYIEGDAELLTRCDGILMLDNYKESKGAVSELALATALKMPIYYSIEELINSYA